MNRDDILIEAGALMERLDDPNLRLFDATIHFFQQDAELTAREIYEQGHIPGAAFFDHDDFSDAGSNYMYMVPAEAELAAQLGAAGIGNDSDVVFYTTGVLPCATRAWWLLRYAGHDRVRILNGGLKGWKKAGGRLEQGDRRYPPATYETHLRPALFASKEEVLALMDDETVRTVNTLTVEHYQRAHIAGSACLPCLDLMEDWDALLPDEALAARLEEEAGYGRVITYCGGGIAATVNAVAHLIAGNENVAVYDGSMDEWAGEGLPLGRAAAE